MADQITCFMVWGEMSIFEAGLVFINEGGSWERPHHNHSQTKKVHKNWKKNSIVCHCGLRIQKKSVKQKRATIKMYVFVYTIKIWSSCNLKVYIVQFKRNGQKSLSSTAARALRATSIHIKRTATKATSK